MLNALQATKTAVQTLYTEQSLSAHLLRQKNAGRSLRQIAAQFGKPITHADVQRGLRGEFPKNAEKRKAFGLAPCPIPVNVYILVALAMYYKPPKPRIYHKWRDMPVSALRTSILNREVI